MTKSHIFKKKKKQPMSECIRDSKIFILLIHRPYSTFILQQSAVTHLFRGD